MISNEAWRELVAALVAQLKATELAFREEPPKVLLTYEEIESAPDIDVTWDPEREVVTIAVRS